MKAANKQGGFDNLTDSVERLWGVLEESFLRVDIDVVGSLAYFRALGSRAL